MVCPFMGNIMNYQNVLQNIIKKQKGKTKLYKEFYCKNSENLTFILSFKSFHFRISALLSINELLRIQLVVSQNIIYQFQLPFLFEDHSIH
jgi:hypothetical protein